MITKMEMHKKTNLNLSEMINKIQEMGYTCDFELKKKGILLYLVNNNGVYLDMLIKLYDDYEGYEYEIEVKNKDDFMKVYNIFSKLI